MRTALWCEFSVGFIMIFTKIVRDDDEQQEARVYLHRSISAGVELESRRSEVRTRRARTSTSG
jgi:hypothetical protein